MLFECKAVCIVILVLVLWSICLSSSLVRFKNRPESITIGTAYVFIRLLRFLQLSWVWSIFLVLLRYSFLIFSFIFLCLIVLTSTITKYFLPSFQAVRCFPDFAILFLPFVLFYKHGTFFNTEFHSNILVVYIYIFLSEFLVFGKYFYIILIHRAVDLFL